jgi:hypothetical protein
LSQIELRDLDELRELSDPRRFRNGLAASGTGPALAVPLLVRRTDRFAYAVGHPKLFDERARDRRVMLDHPVDVPVTAHRELDPYPEPPDQRMARTQPAERRDGASCAVQLVLVLGRLEGNVVAEPLRLLVRVGVAPDVDQQRRVVHRRPPWPVEPHPLRDPQRDQALAQYVLHRLAETEVDTQRQRSDQLGKSHAVGTAGHPITIPTPAIDNRPFDRRYPARARAFGGVAIPDEGIVGPGRGCDTRPS